MEFSRIVNFSDAVYAIAMTLLALDLRILRIPGDADDPAAMWSALGDLVPQLVAFGVGFVLLARYWLAHHDFVARLGAFDSRLIGLNLVYLGFVALLPFPTALIGEFESNPVSGVLFAAALAAISSIETVMFVHARRAGLLDPTPSPELYRWERAASLAPAAMFVVTMPLAALSPTIMLLSWLVVGQVTSFVFARHKPRDAA